MIACIYTDPKLSRVGLGQDRKQNLERNLALELKLQPRKAEYFFSPPPPHPPSFSS